MHDDLIHVLNACAGTVKGPKPAEAMVISPAAKLLSLGDTDSQYSGAAS